MPIFMVVFVMLIPPGHKLVHSYLLLNTSCVGVIIICICSAVQCETRLDIDIQANYKEIWLRKQKIVNYNNKHENTNRVQHDYEVGQCTYIIRELKYHKLEGDKLGPLRITQVHTNGCVVIQRLIFNELIYIQRLTPHF